MSGRGQCVQVVPGVLKNLEPIVIHLEIRKCQSSMNNDLTLFTTIDDKVYYT